MMADLRCEEELRPEDSPGAGTAGTTAAARSSGGGYSQPLVCRAYKDPVILEDIRVFHNMLDIEEFYTATANYFNNTQSEIKPHMRKIVTDWMLEVCLDQNCHADVFLLSTNIMDRFLSQINIKKTQFQLVAAASIFISSKLVDPCPIAGCDLVKYTDNTYTITELLEMELLILSKLKWDLSAVTPYDFLEYLLRLLGEEGTNIDSVVLRRHTENFIILCATEYRFSMYPPSMLSSAALAAAASCLSDSMEQLDQEELISRLQILTRVENDCLQGCIQEIETTFQAAKQNVNTHFQAVQPDHSTTATITSQPTGPSTSSSSHYPTSHCPVTSPPLHTSNQTDGNKTIHHPHHHHHHHHHHQHHHPAQPDVGGVGGGDVGHQGVGAKNSDEEQPDSERSSQTPTEVFSVDFLYVA